jgi:methylthioribose-1-phosphate isomerase
MFKPVEWCGDSLRLLDQTRLPLAETYIETNNYRVVADAIRSLAVRGAPLIGVTAAYAVALAAHHCPDTDPVRFRRSIDAAIAELRSTRPTAVNLFRALQRMSGVLDRQRPVNETISALEQEAIAIHREDELMCRRIGEFGNTLVPNPAAIITHCNTGACATGGAGTAQSVITTAFLQGKLIQVFADETRPLLQGARLTAWELQSLGIDVTVMTDSMAAAVMQRRHIDLVIVGADRIAANGDSANKIGTYNLAVIARHHGIPFYVAAPSTTIDPSVPAGSRIPIEERDPREVTQWGEHRIAPAGIKVYSPAFDVTPADLITAIITDRGIIRPPYEFGPEWKEPGG